MHLNNPLPGVPLVESPLFSQFFAEGGLNSDIREIAVRLHSDGYVVLSDFIPGIQDLCDRIVGDVQHRFDLEAWRASRKEGKHVGLRIQDVYSACESVRELATAAPILTLLERLYGRKPFPFQTLNFPVGTEQHYHTDSLHFSSHPEKFMCGVWVALEDIGMDQGPLKYYPGSHKLPVYENVHYGFDAMGRTEPGRQRDYDPVWDAIAEAQGYEETKFCAKKGDILLWAANLLHGGSEHLSSEKTRWSQVTHYFFEGTAYYTPMNSDVIKGKIAFREPVDQVSGEPTKNDYCGERLDPEWILTSRPPSLLERAGLPPGFDPVRYLELHPDVRAAGVDPTRHYLISGRKEGRSYR